MKTLYSLALCCMSAVIATSCSSDAEEEQLSNALVPVEISANIGQITRAYNSSWEAGDQIGLFVTNNVDGNAYKDYTNYPYETTGDINFSPIAGSDPVYYPSDGSKIDFQGYYPYSATLSGTTFTVADWSNQSAQKDLDLLIAAKESGHSMAESERAVQLTFRHQFSKLIFNIVPNSEESQLSAADLAGMAVKAAGMNVALNCDVLTGVQTQGSAVATAITFNTMADGSQSTAIICPDFNTNTEARKLTFTLSSGRTFSWTIPSGTKFESGKSYTWSLSLKGDGLVSATLTAVIEDWDNQDMPDLELEYDN